MLPRLSRLSLSPTCVSIILGLLWEARATARFHSRNKASLSNTGGTLSSPSSGSPSEMGPTPSASKGRARTAGSVGNRENNGADPFQLGSENTFSALRSPASVKKPGVVQIQEATPLKSICVKL